MTKEDMVKLVAERFEIKTRESKDLVETVINMIKSTLASGEDLKISGFGNFVVNQKKDRKGRNPQTGESITIEARRVITFRPSPVLKNAINSGENPR